MAITREMVEILHGYLECMTDVHFDEWKNIALQPSLTDQKVQMEVCAQMIAETFNRVGIDAKVLESPTNPVIYAEKRCSKESAPTVLFYGYYDTKKVPSEIAVMGDTLYGYGASNKGQFLAHVMAIQSYLETFGDLPVHVKFLLEGEKENGSFNLPMILEENRELLKTDLIYISDGCTTKKDSLQVFCKDSENRLVKEVLNALKEVYKSDPEMKSFSELNIPVSILEEKLHAPVICVPYENLDIREVHSNDSMNMISYFNGIHTTVQILFAIGQ